MFSLQIRFHSCTRRRRLLRCSCLGYRHPGRWRRRLRRWSRRARSAANRFARKCWRSASTPSVPRVTTMSAARPVTCPSSMASCVLTGRESASTTSPTTPSPTRPRARPSSVSSSSFIPHERAKCYLDEPSAPATISRSSSPFGRECGLDGRPGRAVDCDWRIARLPERVAQFGGVGLGRLDIHALSGQVDAHLGAGPPP